MGIELTSLEKLIWYSTSLPLLPYENDQFGIKQDKTKQHNLNLK
jgi:hypothetical protein